VVAELVGEDVGLREVAGRAEAPLQLVVEAEVDVDLFVAGAVERAGRGLGEAAGRLDGVTEQYELGVLVRLPALTEELLPGGLGIV